MLIPLIITFGIGGAIGVFVGMFIDMAVFGRIKHLNILARRWKARCAACGPDAKFFIPEPERGTLMEPPP